jgi:hypothetical protein
MPRIFWFVLAAMLAAWLGMNLVTVPRIEAAAGGLRLLDMRFTGYTQVEVKEFVAALGDEGTALYLGAQFWLDMIFPPLLGAVIFFFFRWLFPGLAGLVIGIVSMTYVATDILENLAVAKILRAGADGLTHEMAATANMWTLSKWRLSLVGLTMLLVGIVLRLRRRRVSRKPAKRQDQ